MRRGDEGEEERGRGQEGERGEKRKEGLVVYQ
jgi:hypothetical protein